MKCDVNPQTQEKTPLYIATTLQPPVDKDTPTDMDHNQEQLISELLKAGAVYEQKVHHQPTEEISVNGPSTSQKVVFNDMHAAKCVQFIEASSVHIDQILMTKYNPLLIAYNRGAFRGQTEQDSLNEQDVNEILKYV